MGRGAERQDIGEARADWTIGWIEKHFFWKVLDVNVSKVALCYQNTICKI